VTQMTPLISIPQWSKIHAGASSSSNATDFQRFFSEFLGSGHVGIAYAYGYSAAALLNGLKESFRDVARSRAQAPESEGVSLSLANGYQSVTLRSPKRPLYRPQAPRGW
jgi:hypothetical protein